MCEVIKYFDIKFKVFFFLFLDLFIFFYVVLLKKENCKICIDFNNGWLFVMVDYSYYNKYWFLGCLRRGIVWGFIFFMFMRSIVFISVWCVVRVLVRVLVLINIWG